MLVFDSWHHAQPLMYCSTNSCSLGPSYCSRTSSQVLEIPGWPAEGESWRSFRILCRSSGSSSRKILQICGAKRWSGRRTRGSEVSTPLLRSSFATTNQPRCLLTQECVLEYSRNPGGIQSIWLDDQLSYADHGSIGDFCDQCAHELGERRQGRVVDHT